MTLFLPLLHEKMLTKLEVDHVERARSGVYVAVLLQNLRLIYFGWAWQESFALHLISGISHLFKSSFVSEIYLVKHVAQSLKPRYSQHCL